MATEEFPWFVVYRSEALAGLLLTARKDVEGRGEKKNDDGVDFLLAVNEGGPLPTRLFVVQVKDTTSSNLSEWMKGVKEIFQPRTGMLFLPVCVFVVNIRDNRALYAWVAEPCAHGQQAKLHFPPTPTFRDLDEAAVDDIVNRVKGWYDVLPRQPVPTAFWSLLSVQCWMHGLFPVLRSWPVPESLSN
jgi:hypothetical protein